MKYIDCYEIEYRSEDGLWERVAEVYPNYRWRTVRPWFFLGLICRAKIINNAEAAALQARCEAADIALGLIKGNVREHFRIWQRRHNGWWLRKEIDAEFSGHLI